MINYYKLLSIPFDWPFDKIKEKIESLRTLDIYIADPLVLDEIEKTLCDPERRTQYDKDLVGINQKAQEININTPVDGFHFNLSQAIKSSDLSFPGFLFIIKYSAKLARNIFSNTELLINCTKEEFFILFQEYVKKRLANCASKLTYDDILLQLDLEKSVVNELLFYFYFCPETHNKLLDFAKQERILVILLIRFRFEKKLKTPKIFKLTETFDQPVLQNKNPDDPHSAAIVDEMMTGSVNLPDDFNAAVTMLETKPSLDAYILFSLYQKHKTQLLPVIFKNKANEEKIQGFAWIVGAAEGMVQVIIDELFPRDEEEIIRILTDSDHAFSFVGFFKRLVSHFDGGKRSSLREIIFKNKNDFQRNLAYCFELQTSFFNLDTEKSLIDVYMENPEKIFPIIDNIYIKKPDQIRKLIPAYDFFKVRVEKNLDHKLFYILYKLEFSRCGLSLQDLFLDDESRTQYYLLKAAQFNPEKTSNSLIGRELQQYYSQRIEVLEKKIKDGAQEEDRKRSYHKSWSHYKLGFLYSEQVLADYGIPLYNIHKAATHFSDFIVNEKKYHYADKRLKAVGQKLQTLLQMDVSLDLMGFVEKVKDEFYFSIMEKIYMNLNAIHARELMLSEYNLSNENMLILADNCIKNASAENNIVEAFSLEVAFHVLISLKEPNDVVEHFVGRLNLIPFVIKHIESFIEKSKLIINAQRENAKIYKKYLYCHYLFAENLPKFRALIIECFSNKKHGSDEYLLTEKKYLLEEISDLYPNINPWKTIDPNNKTDKKFLLVHMGLIKKFKVEGYRYGVYADFHRHLFDAVKSNFSGLNEQDKIEVIECIIVFMCQIQIIIQGRVLIEFFPFLAEDYLTYVDGESEFFFGANILGVGHNLGEEFAHFILILILRSSNFTLLKNLPLRIIEEYLKNNNMGGSLKEDIKAIKILIDDRQLALKKASYINQFSVWNNVVDKANELLIKRRFVALTKQKPPSLLDICRDRSSHFECLKKGFYPLELDVELKEPMKTLYWLSQNGSLEDVRTLVLRINADASKLIKSESQSNSKLLYNNQLLYYYMARILKDKFPVLLDNLKPEIYDSFPQEIKILIQLLRNFNETILADIRDLIDNLQKRSLPILGTKKVINFFSYEAAEILNKYYPNTPKTIDFTLKMVLASPDGTHKKMELLFLEVLEKLFDDKSAGANHFSWRMCFEFARVGTHPQLYKKLACLALNKDFIYDMEFDIYVLPELFEIDYFDRKFMAPPPAKKIPTDAFMGLREISGDFLRLLRSQLKPNEEKLKIGFFETQINVNNGNVNKGNILIEKMIRSLETKENMPLFANIWSWIVLLGFNFFLNLHADDGQFAKDFAKDIEALAAGLVGPSRQDFTSTFDLYIQKIQQYCDKTYGLPEPENHSRNDACSIC